HRKPHALALDEAREDVLGFLVAALPDLWCVDPDEPDRLPVAEVEGVAVDHVGDEVGRPGWRRCPPRLLGALRPRLVTPRLVVLLAMGSPIPRGSVRPTRPVAARG